MYISQNQIGSNVHMPNSPSSSKEVRRNTLNDHTMQSLIPLMLAVSLASGAPLSLLPYAYYSSPIPVYHQYQDTGTGVHAYSYAGGPSAKEEVKDADGVRGSYSYVDANGILQSVFYVADDNGFRVAATNLPTDDNLNAETAHVVLARSANAEDSSRSSRRRRSVEDSISNQQIQLVHQEGEPLLLTSHIPTATSHQSQVQVHNNARLDVAEGEADVKPVDLQPILPLQTILGGPVLARAPTYHENRIELHKELGIEGPRPKDAVKIDHQPLTVLRSSHVAVPVGSAILAREALPVVPVVQAGQIGTSTVTTSISSHGISQIHGPSRITKEAVAVPAVSGVVAKGVVPVAVERKGVPVVPVAEGNLATATVTTSISSHGISQVHGDSKVQVEPALFVKTAPIAQLHPVVNVPVYFH